MGLKTVALLAGCGLALAAATRPPRHARHRGRAAAPATPSTRVVILGAGFGGLQAALGLAGRPGIHLTVIDAHNHHLFQPLLYQVATAALAPTDIAAPVRDVIPASGRVRVLMETVTGIDPARRIVTCGPHQVPYDELIVATGSRPSYFGHADWAEAATGLKTLQDALSLRNQIMRAFEDAAVATDEAERRRLLTFVMIGGGPNGVEMAGSVAELARDMLARNYFMPGARARVVVLEAGPAVLSEFARPLSQYTRRALGSLGVEVRTGCKVTALQPGRVTFKGEHGEESLDTGVIVWTAGTEGTPVARWLGVAPGRGGLLPVGPDLRVPGVPGVTAIGDVALLHDSRGRKLPALAPVAKQQGTYAARRILGAARGRPVRTPFRYRDYGTLATIGRNRAVAELGPVRLQGATAWITWAVAHIFFLIGFRNRVLVATQWFFAYLLNQRSGRLITEVTDAVTETAAQPPVAKPGYSVMPPSTNSVAPVT